MYFFLFLSIPSTIFYFILTDSKYKIKQLSIPLFFGFFSGIITSIFIEFLFTSETNANYSFISALITNFSSTFFPLAILSSILIFISKDNLEYKSYSIFPLVGMFYTIYLPYVTIAKGEPYSFFMNFINPILYIETILFFSCAATYGIKIFSISINDKKKYIIALSTVLLSLLVQPIFYSLWYLHILAPFAYGFAIILLPISIITHNFFYKTKNILDNNK